MTEAITLDVQPMAIVTLDGIDGELSFQAPGIDIYVKGRYQAARWHQISYLAQLECQARHIPVKALRDVRVSTRAKKHRVDAKQLKFGGF